MKNTLYHGRPEDVSDRLEKEMKKAAKMMEYEYAAVLRDQIIELRGVKK